MSGIGICIMAVLAVYGAYELMRSALLRLLYTRTDSGADIVIYVRANEDRLEGTVRALAARNPEAKIVIADDLKDECARPVAARLQRLLPRVHIGHIK